MCVSVYVVYMCIYMAESYEIVASVGQKQMKVISYGSCMYLYIFQILAALPKQ